MLYEPDGEVCGFLDPDDMITVSAIKEVMNCYHSNPHIISTYSKIKLINEKSEEIGEFKNTLKIKNGDKI